MKHLRRIPAIVLPVLLVTCGATAALSGVYLLLGVAPTLVIGGTVAVGVGLLVDI